VTGRHDSSTPIDPHGLFLTNNIPDAIGKELDASHLAPLDCPEGVVDALIGFCA
jgi:3-oxoadipate enol-lactonase